MTVRTLRGLSIIKERKNMTQGGLNLSTNEKYFSLIINYFRALVQHYIPDREKKPS